VAVPREAPPGAGQLSATTEKRAAARAALDFIAAGSVIGVGTGTTSAIFVGELASRGPRIAAAVPSSRDTEGLLRAAGIRVVRLEDAGRLSVYVDGADEVGPDFELLKGGGGAHAAEKRLAVSADLFVCIVDSSKPVIAIGFRPVPLEVVTTERGRVEAELCGMGGVPRIREGFVTDGGGEVLDVSGLDLADPAAIEDRLESIPGVVACGIFARRRADVVIVGEPGGAVSIRTRDRA
jgi:ribose 5-phosphate isomerase A